MRHVPFLPTLRGSTHPIYGVWHHRCQPWAVLLLSSCCPIHSCVSRCHTNPSGELLASGNHAQNAHTDNSQCHAALHLHPNGEGASRGAALSGWCMERGVLILCRCHRGRCRVCLTPSCRTLLGRSLCSPWFRSLELGHLDRHSRHYWASSPGNFSAIKKQVSWDPGHSHQCCSLRTCYTLTQHGIS